MTECLSVIVTGVGLPEEGGLNLNPCVVRFHTNHIGQASSDTYVKITFTMELY
nr:MAG TPA: hypothetical protein [Caudoviricetes sp.]